MQQKKNSLHAHKYNLPTTETKHLHSNITLLDVTVKNFSYVQQLFGQLIPNALYVANQRNK